MKVLIPIDVTHPHEDLVDHLDWLLPLEGSEVTLLFVKEILPAYENVMAASADFPEDWVNIIDKTAKGILEPVKEQMTSRGARVSVEIATGAPELVIADFAKSRKVDVTVVAPGHHSNIDRFLLGSTSANVVSLAPATIVLLRDNPNHNELDRIVFGVDGTPQSIYAMKKAVEVFHLDKKPISAWVVNVVAMPPIVNMLTPAGVLVGLQKNLEMQGETIIADALKALTDLGVTKVEPVLKNGDPASELIKLAQLNNAQLIVTGAQGHGALEHVFMGSVANRVVSHARCSAAVVKMSK